MAVVDEVGVTVVVVEVAELTVVLVVTVVDVVAVVVETVVVDVSVLVLLDSVDVTMAPPLQTQHASLAVRPRFAFSVAPW